MDSPANDLYFLFCAYIKEPLIFARGDNEKAVLGKFIDHVNNNRENFKDLLNNIDDGGIKLLSLKKLQNVEPGGVVPMKVSTCTINPGDTITLTKQGIFIMEMKLEKKFIIL